MHYSTYFFCIFLIFLKKIFWKYSGTDHFLLCICFSQGTCRVGSGKVPKYFCVSGWTQACLELLRGIYWEVSTERLLYLLGGKGDFLFSRHLVPSCCCAGFQSHQHQPLASWLVSSSRHVPGVYVSFKMCHPHMVRPTSKVQSMGLDHWLDIEQKGKGRFKL